MPLPSPILDDRSYAQLRDELIRRIPVYNPEWTDHNASDPGITLLELFSFLGENLLYRFNQIPETAKLEFLRLLQVPLRPAEPATALLALHTKELAGVPVPIGTEARAGKVAFETLVECYALPVSATAVAKVAGLAPDPESELYGYYQEAVDAATERGVGTPAPYEVQRVANEPNKPAIDFGTAVDQTLWVAVFASEEEPKLARQRIVEHDRAPLLLNLGVIIDEQVQANDIPDPCLGNGIRVRTAAVDWQISTGRLTDAGDPIFAPLALKGDTTEGIATSGVVRLQLPTRTDQLGIFDVEDAARRGTGDLPPELGEDEQEKLLFWIRAFRKDGSDFGRISYLDANATWVSQSKKAQPEYVGTGSGQPNQIYRLVHHPVLHGTLSLDVEEPGGWRAWQEVDSFVASGESDRHYVLDHEAGTVRFGNGIQGYAPQIGERIRARTYSYGGGPEGNVATEAISKLPALSTVKAANPWPASGGAVAESVTAALERIPGELRRRDRATTRDDFKELALATPGAGIIRAETLPLFDPVTRNTEAAGVVSVLVWPESDPREPDAPKPTRPTLKRVCEWLDARRLVTTELYVIPPRYRQIAVVVGVAVKPDFGVDAVRTWVETVLRQYLAPVPPYGPTGQGWPLGRAVRAAELEAATVQVDGVEYVEGFRLAQRQTPQAPWQRQELVELELDEVPQLVDIIVEEGPPTREPGEQGEPPSQDEGPLISVPVPEPQEIC